MMTFKPRALRSFTLTELLAAMAIIAIIAGVTAISVRTIARDAKLSSASNTIAAALDTARGLAIRDNKLTVLVFRPRLDGSSRQYIELVTAHWTGESHPNVPNIGVVDRFVPVPGVNVRRLPNGIGVAGPQYGGAMDHIWQTCSYFPGITTGEPAGALLGIMFTSDGTIAMRNAVSDSQRIYLDVNQDAMQQQDGEPFSNTGNSSNYPDNNDYCDLGLGPSGNVLAQYFCQQRPDDEPYLTLVPYLSVFDDALARDQMTLNWTSGQDRNLAYTSFIDQNADRIHFNRYTGVVMR